jgi:aryl-alcohol dehydrogenase-like predicted oxidoreductase
VAQRGGIYAERVTARGVAIGNAFGALAAQAGLSAAQLALLWVKDQPGITAPIFGVRTLAQLEEALPITELALSDELRAACDALVAPGSAVVNFHNSAAWMKMALS